MVVFRKHPITWRGQRCAGLCDHNRARILVWRGERPRAAVEETFAHELGHALAGLAPTSRERLRDRAAEKRIVERMAPAFRALLLLGRRWRARVRRYPGASGPVQRGEAGRGRYLSPT